MGITMRARWYQFTVRTLLGISVLVSAAMSWHAVIKRRADSQREARRALERLDGAYCDFDYQLDERGGLRDAAAPTSPRWARRLLGDDFVHNVTRVELYGVDHRLMDDELDHLKGFPGLRALNIRGVTMTDAGMAHFAELKKLESLWLESVPITDAGLAHLKGLTRLRQLGLVDTHVTDAGLVHLQGLANLEVLWVSQTRVTEEGARKLENALPQLQILR